MQKRKTIEIKKKESQKSYFEAIKPTSKPVKEPQVRKSILISKDLDEKIKAYIYTKRTQGDIFYTQTHLIKEALGAFLDKP